MARVNGHREIANKAHEVMLEALVVSEAKLDAAKRVIVKMQTRSKAARRRAKETREHLNARYSDIALRKTELVEELSKTRRERNAALNDVQELKKKLEERAARIRDTDIELRVLRGRVGLPTDVTVIGAKGSLIQMRSAVLAVCARIGIKPVYPSATPVRSNEPPMLLGVSLSDDDAYVRAMFTIEERIGKLLDVVERLCDARGNVDDLRAWRAEAYGPTP